MTPNPPSRTDALDNGVDWEDADGRDDCLGGTGGTLPGGLTGGVATCVGVTALLPATGGVGFCGTAGVRVALLTGGVSVFFAKSLRTGGVRDATGFTSVVGVPDGLTEGVPELPLDDV